MVRSPGELIAEFMEAHHRYVMTGEGDEVLLLWQINHLHRVGALNAEDAEELRSAMRRPQAEINLERIAAGESADRVYGQSFRPLAHFAGYVLWLAILIMLAILIAEQFQPPEEKFWNVLGGIIGMFGWLFGAALAHDRTTGKMIDRYFDGE